MSGVGDIAVCFSEIMAEILDRASEVEDVSDLPLG
jgi:hypothetical protein